MENIEEKSIEELEVESTLLRLQLLKIENEINKRKRKERRGTTDLKDRKGRAIKIGDKVKLLTKSTKNSPFAGQQFAKVIGIAHNGTRVALAHLDNEEKKTDRIPSNVEVVEVTEVWRK